MLCAQDRTADRPVCGGQMAGGVGGWAWQPDTQRCPRHVEWSGSVRRPGGSQPCRPLHPQRLGSREHLSLPPPTTPLKAQSLLQTCPGSLTETAVSSARCPVLEGRITRSVLSPNKKEKEALCPLHWPRSPWGAATALSCDLGQPAAPSALSACRPRVRVSELSVNQGTHDAVPAPEQGQRHAGQRVQNCPSTQVQGPPPSAPKPSCLPGPARLHGWAGPPWPVP